MKPDTNPFRPGFSSMPPVLAGRASFQDAMASVFVATSLHPRAFVVLTGQRGIGKTVLAEAVAAEARRLQWHTAYWAARTDDATVENISRELADILPKRHARRRPSSSPAQRTVKGGVNAGVVSGGMEKSQADPTVNRTGYGRWLLETCESLGARNQGVLLVIDEAQNVPTAELEELGGLMSDAARRATSTPPAPIKLAVVFAGLPTFRTVVATAMSFSAERLTYVTLEALTPTETAAALATPIANTGRSISNDALEYLTDKSGGYPYFIQLHGYHTWAIAGATTEITITHAEAGHLVARSEYESSLFETRLAKLPDLPLAMLYAIALEADDNGTALTRRVADRLQRSTRALSSTRQRLIDAGLIRSYRRGEMTEAVPGLLDYLGRNVNHENLSREIAADSGGSAPRLLPPESE